MESDLPDRTSTLFRDHTPAIGRDLFRPSGHTGLLLSALREFLPAGPLETGLDMGVGSGAVLAMLGLIGVERLIGVDIDPDALTATRDLLTRAGLVSRADLRTGSLWEPLIGERFDIIASNLPQFAATEPSDPDHSPHWSFAGADGRQFMDPFLEGLRDHMHEHSVVFITHNRFLGMARTDALLKGAGLTGREVSASAVLLHPRKAALLQPEIRALGTTAGIIKLGDYEFIEVQILEIRLTTGN